MSNEMSTTETAAQQKRIHFSLGMSFEIMTEIDLALERGILREPQTMGYPVYLVIEEERLSEALRALAK